MKKQNLFHIFKFTSDRLKDKNFKLSLTIDEAKNNGEIVSISNSQIIKSIKENLDLDLNRIRSIKSETKKIKKEKHSKVNSIMLCDLYKEKEQLLFIPEIISITMNCTAHYDYLFENGLTLNNKIFRRFMCGSGQGRKSKVLFVDEETIKRIKPILENDYDKSIEMNVNKINAYFGLYGSNAITVSNLNVCVVKDFEVTLTKKVDYIFQGKERNWVKPIELPISLKTHDGMGIITVEGATKWAREVGVEDYIPAQFGVRHSYIKGMLATFDIKDFIAKELKDNNYWIIDAWGNKVDARSIDVFLTTSQFKLWKNYVSWESFIESSNKNKIVWGISRVSPKNDIHNCFANYQYLQSLKMDGADIQDVCQQHISWIKGVIGADIPHTLLYLLGKGINDLKNVSQIQNTYIKALILDNKLINDPYIKNKVYNGIRKKIKKSYSGKILINGNYQTMVSDIYGLAEHIFKISPVKGLLKDGEHFSAYWNNKGVSKVDACRSPLTHYSEHNILNLQNNDNINYWFKYQNSGIIYSMWGTDTITHADSDFDLDLVCTTNNPTFLKCAMKDTLPITYKKKPTPVTKVTDESLYHADLMSFNNDIGVITNYSTSMYAMLPYFREGSVKHNMILDRLKITRMLQGNSIDKAKGIEVKDIPSEWLRYQEIIKTDTQATKNQKRLLNKLVINKKPYFMSWIYPKLRNQYKDYMGKADLYCKTTFGLPLEDLKEKRPKTDEEKVFFKLHSKYMPLNMSDCVMNKLSWYMESVAFNIKKDLKNGNMDEIIEILMDSNIKKDEDRYNQILKLYKEYINQKKLHAKLDYTNNYKDKHEEDDFEDLAMFNNSFKQKAYAICSNTDELINYAVEIAYKLNPSKNKDFVWDVFGDDALVNLLKNKLKKLLIPLPNTKGDIKYLGNTYKNTEVKYDF